MLDPDLAESLEWNLAVNIFVSRVDQHSKHVTPRTKPRVYSTGSARVRRRELEAPTLAFPPPRSTVDESE